MDRACLQRGDYTILEFFHIVRKHDDARQAYMKKCQNVKTLNLSSQVVPPQYCPQPLRIQVNLHELCTAS